MNAAWKQSIPILTGAAPRGALAGAIKLFALFSAIILLSFFVMADFSTAAPPQKSAVRAPAAQPAAANSSIPSHTPAAKPAVASIKVITPQAGASFSIGSTKTIEWQYSNLTGTIRILLYKGGAPSSGFPLVSLTLDNSGKGSFNWAIHSDLKPGSDYTIVIESNNKPGVKGVSSLFSITDKVMASSMKVERYVFENGMVRDLKTGLMWAANDNGSPINWVGAKTYCESYHGGGYSGWRMPSTVELAALEAGGAHKDKIKMSVCVGHLCNVWASETKGSEAAFYAFNGGGVVWYTQSASNLWRALPVRNAK